MHFNAIIPSGCKVVQWRSSLVPVLTLNEASAVCRRIFDDDPEKLYQITICVERRSWENVKYKHVCPSQIVDNQYVPTKTYITRSYHFFTLYRTGYISSHGNAHVFTCWLQFIPETSTLARAYGSGVLICITTVARQSISWQKYQQLIFSWYWQDVVTVQNKLKESGEGQMERHGEVASSDSMQMKNNWQYQT